MTMLDPTLVSALPERARVLQLIKAVSKGNWMLVGKVVRGSAVTADETGWSTHGLLALRVWIEEALSQRAQFFTEDERFGLDRRLTHRQLLLAQERAALDVRPSLAVALAAMALMGR